jgi:CheY-like chemotaxis protein
VTEACYGEEALRVVEQTQPDLVLLDIGMPVLDGFGVIRKIRENPRFASMPIVAVTAYAMQGDREKILSSNFDGYLSKPVDARSLSRARPCSEPRGGQESSANQNPGKVSGKARAAAREGK